MRSRIFASCVLTTALAGVAVPALAAAPCSCIGAGNSVATATGPGGHGGRIVYIGHGGTGHIRQAARLHDGGTAYAVGILRGGHHARMARTGYADRIISDYAENYYDYRSESRVDEASYSHQWRVVPAGYVPPDYASADYSDTPDLPPYGGNSGADERNGSLDNSFSGGVGYGAEADGGGGGGTVALAQPNSLNSGGDYDAANRLSAWRAYNHIRGSNGY